ncbi:MAG: peptidoglycan DD-metalloendopeptidase family protein [Bacteroidales bacterium]|nr:peptidoglycan DD-metalloendopeptidase family protein [Bacteroidales bacterium]
MKFTYFPFICLFLWTFQNNIIAQVVPDNSEVIEEFEEIESDTSNLSCNDSSVIQVPVFDTTLVPAAALYKSWNHFYVNPYDTDFVKKPDTTLINLAGYRHPHNNYLTSDFGFRRSRHHYGVDIKVNTGDTIYSSFDGMIRICKYSRSFGNYIVVRHYNGLETIYAHLSRSLVALNQIVKSGEPIGLGGNTGRSTGPHLHYEVRYLGQNINPHDIIDFQNYCIKGDSLNLCSQNFAYIGEIRKIRYHVVRKGDTLGRIAMKYGVSIKHLCKLNRIKSTKILRIGQRLRYT